MMGRKRKGAARRIFNFKLKFKKKLKFFGGFLCEKMKKKIK